jgi:hypothetical protein
MTKLKKKKTLNKIKLQNISDFYLYQNDNENCQFFIVRDDNQKPNLVMVYRNFENEQQILDFIEGIRLADNPQSSRTIH